jgi:hypothetical protein
VEAVDCRSLVSMPDLMSPATQLAFWDRFQTSKTRVSQDGPAMGPGGKRTATSYIERHGPAPISADIYHRSASALGPLING